MTAIIFQLMRSTISDFGFNTGSYQRCPALVVGFAIARTYEPNSNSLFKTEILLMKVILQNLIQIHKLPKNQKDDQLKLVYIYMYYSIQMMV